MVVDDDKIIRKNIIESPNWEKNGFCYISEAYDGNDALKKIEEKQPDLIISDICMPCMDGIELIQCVKQKYPHIKFIVLSNYDDFKYVKATLKNGALDYILKYEISKESLDKLLQQVRETLENEMRKDENNRFLKEIESKLAIEKTNSFWERLVEGKLTKQELEADAKTFGVSLVPMHGTFLMARCTGNDFKKAFEQAFKRIKDLLKQEDNEIDIWSFKLRNDDIGIYTNFKRELGSTNITLKIMAKIHWIPDLKQFNNYPYIISVSDVFHSAQYMMSYAVKTREMLETIYYDPTNKIITSRTFIPFLKKVDMPKYEKEIDRILETLLMKNLPDVFTFIEELVSDIVKSHIDPVLVIEIYHYLIHELNKICRVRNIENISFYSNGIIPLNLLNEVNDIFTAESIIKELIKEIDKELYAVNIISNNEEIKKAIDYIAKNYSSPIGLREVAEAVGLSKNHFCRLFKQETGENFLDYLNNLRIERAKQLLVSTELNINSIAQNVGFSEYRYFKQVFFKYTGSFPSECRKASII